MFRLLYEDLMKDKQLVQRTESLIPFILAILTKMERKNAMPLSD